MADTPQGTRVPSDRAPTAGPRDAAPSSSPDVERLRALPTGADVERLTNEIANVRHLTLIHEGDEVRPASLSYVKPSEYQRQVNALLDRAAELLRAAPVGTESIR